MIHILDHQSGWRDEFSTIASTLRAGLGPLALRVDHIGSTAVPGLCAKNIIDVQVTVAQLDEAVAQALRAMGFEQRGDVRADHVPPGYAGPADDWCKLFFMQPAGQRHINVHVRRQGAPNQRYPLLFRDYLVAHPDTAEAYGRLKRRLAVSLANDGDYPDVKDPAVDLIYLAAQDWAVRVGWTLSTLPQGH